MLEENGEVLRCHNSTAEERLHSEIGASAAILKANYTLDTFMARYRKVDWTDRRNWECNQGCVIFSKVSRSEQIFTPLHSLFGNTLDVKQ